MTALPGITIGPRFAAVRCAVCHDDLMGATATCARCGTVTHGECRQGLARCPTLACSVPAWWDAVVPGAPGTTTGRHGPGHPWHPGDLAAFLIAALLLVAMLVGTVVALNDSLDDTLFNRATSRICSTVTTSIK